MSMKAIIIGATSGLGREVAVRLAGKGWTIGATGRRRDALEALQQELGKDKVHIATMDVTKPEATAALDSLIEEMGAPDLLFHVSGVGYQNRELDLEKEIRTVRTNCEGMVRIVDHFLNFVRNHKDIYTPAHKAHVAVITSIAGTAGMGTAPAYSATKRMLQTYISALVQLCNMEKIPVQFTDIRPGFVLTPLLNPEKVYPMAMTTETAGKHIVKAIEKKKRIYTFDWRFRMLVLGWKLIPRCIWVRFTWVKN